MLLYRTRPIALAAVAVVAAVALSLVAPVSASAAQRWSVPEGGTLLIDGKGYGHGKGMSQYGAEGAARKGLSYRKIVNFYYPSTTWGEVRGRVKVNISADTTDDVVVRPRKHLRVRDIGARQTHFLPQNGAKQWRLTTNRKNRTVVQWRTKRAWKRWKALRGEGYFAAGGRPITLVTPSGQVAYRGRLRAAAPFAGSRARDTVNILTMEKYLRGVVPLEMPASWHPEAVRSQSIAARTYATYERSHPLAKHYQICDTTQCQVYGGHSAEHALSNAAIKATAREILTYKGAPAFTQFGSSNGGWVASGSMPYQVATEDPYDGWAGNPVHSWQVRVEAATLERTWPAPGTLKRVVVGDRTGQGAWGGRVLAMTLVGSRGTVKLSGDEMRSALGLRSNWFTFTVKEPKKASGKTRG